MTVLGELIDRTPWIDTHEHLVEERNRITGHSDPVPREIVIADDWSALLEDYSMRDLVSVGLPDDAAEEVYGDQLGPIEKWETVAPYFDAARHTGYLRAVDLTTERLFGERLRRETCEEIDRAHRELRKEGYYRTVLRIANVERCQVNSFEEDPFCETDQPDLLDQDLSLVPLMLGRHPRAEAMSQIEVGSLDDYLGVVEWCFDQYAGRAIAAKCLWAYLRPLAVQHVDSAPVRAFELLRAGTATLDERRRVEDYLFARCVDLATESDLPVKVHLGHLNGNGLPGQQWVNAHVTDMTGVVQSHPRTKFVLMHMAWPQQEQLLSLAKHQPNVTVDLCWAWILAPLATRDFVRRFLTTVPANKLLCFGGDYLVAENIVGHAAIARRGLEAALTSLIADEWLSLADAERLIPRLMRDNAMDLFRDRANTEASAKT